MNTREIILYTTSDGTTTPDVRQKQEGENGVTRNTEYSNLVTIKSIDYRVKSQQDTLFRIWVNKDMKEYLIKGYAVKENIKLEQHEDLKQTIKVLADKSKIS